MQNNVFSNRIIGHQIIKLNKVDSTNNYLKKLLSNSKPSKEGTVILTDSQFAGRGQFNHKWLSEPGLNLTFSIHLQPNDINISEQFLINKCLCIAVSMAINTLSEKKVIIKWPNDLYIDEVKIGGILIENLIRGNKITDSIIGIGINVNQEKFPPEIENIASSLKLQNHKHYNLQKVLDSILFYINEWYSLLKLNLNEKIDKAYLSTLKNYNKNIKFLNQGDIKCGILCGVNNDGSLAIKENDKMLLYKHLEIKFI